MIRSTGRSIKPAYFTGSLFINRSIFFPQPNWFAMQLGHPGIINVLLNFQSNILQHMNVPNLSLFKKLKINMGSYKPRYFITSCITSKGFTSEAGFKVAL